jgi:hypothetical protein
MKLRKDMKESMTDPFDIHVGVINSVVERDRHGVPYNLRFITLKSKQKQKQNTLLLLLRGFCCSGSSAQI